VNHSKVGQQLLGLTLRVNPWLWNSAQFYLSIGHWYLEKHRLICKNKSVKQMYTYPV